MSDFDRNVATADYGRPLTRAEAANDKLHTGALIAAGLVLFVLTLVVNAIARSLVARAERGRRAVPETPVGAPA